MAGDDDGQVRELDELEMGGCEKNKYENRESLYQELCFVRKATQ